MAGPPGGLKLPEPILKLDDLEGGLYGKLASGTGNPQIRNQDQGVKEADALLLHRLQADAGNPSSQYLLGYYHYVGSESVPRDFKTAYEYFLAAAKQYPTKEPNEEDARGIIEHKSAKHAAASSAGYLGQIYWRGEGVEADAETARKWFERGASQGNPTSFAFLGIMYQNGVAGLPKDLNLGLENIKKAAAKGSNFGKVLLAEHMLRKLYD